jgi:TBC1 domain family member 8/9
MVVLADEILESFFETDLSASFRLETVPGIELPESSSGLLGGLWSAVATEDNKKIFNRFTDELGKTIGRHQVIHKPSIGRYTTLEEPKARESLLTPAMRRSPSKSTLTSTESTASVATSSTATAVSSLPVAPAPSKPAQLSPTPSAAVKSPVGTPASPELPMISAANAALMERTTFAIDDAGDEDDLSDSEFEDAVHDEVMDEVDAFLEAHDSGLSEADKALAKGGHPLL